MAWYEIADLVIFIVVTVLAINRLLWSILVIYDPLNYAEMRTAIHLANFGTMSFFIHLLDIYIRESMKPTSSSWCSWNAKIGGVMLVVSYFAVWLFYWHRHRIIRRGFNIQLLSNIGVFLMTLGLLGGSATFIIFWSEKLGDDGLCFVVDSHSLIGLSDHDALICIQVTIYLDIICTAYLSGIFIVPLCRRIKSLESSLSLRGVDPRSISNYRQLSAVELKSSAETSIDLQLSTQRMKRALQRTAVAAAIATISTSFCLILFLWARTQNWNLGEKMFLVYVDGIISVYSVHLSLSPKARWFWSWFVSNKKINRKHTNARVSSD